MARYKESKLFVKKINGDNENQDTNGDESGNKMKKDERSLAKALAADDASEHNIVTVARMHHKKKPFEFPSLAHDIPKSDIMQEKNVINKVKMIMERYIVDTAALQVNISSVNRKHLYSKAAKLDSCNIDPNKPNNDIEFLETFFDAAGREILMLLRGSFSNFTSTPVCVIVVANVIDIVCFG